MRWIRRVGAGTAASSPSSMARASGLSVLAPTALPVTQLCLSHNARVFFSMVKEAEMVTGVTILFKHSLSLNIWRWFSRVQVIPPADSSP